MLVMRTLLGGDEEEDLDFALVRVPNVLPRLVEITTGEDRAVILLEEVIERNIQSLFLNYDIITAHPFRIMRNADFTIDEEDAEDLLKEIQKQLKKRQWVRPSVWRLKKMPINGY